MVRPQVMLQSGANVKYDKVLLEPDTYDAEIVEINDFYIDAKEKEGKDGKTTTKEYLKFVWGLKIGSNIIPLYLSANISMGSGNFSNSRLFDILEMSGLMKKWQDFSDNELKDIKEDSSYNQIFLDWFKYAFVGKKCRALIKTVNKGKAEKEYSKVADIQRFIKEVNNVKQSIDSKNA